MLKRTITSIVALAVFIPFLIFSADPPFVFIIATGILSLVAVYEISKCTGFTKYPPICILGMICAVGINIMARYVKDVGKFFTYAIIILFIYSFLMLVFATFSKGKIKVVDSAICAVMTSYVTVSFAMLTLLRDFSIGEVSVGGKIYLLAFVLAWMPDIGGYFAGRLFGKHKLIPDVSPKKTVEGLIGGIVFSIVSALAYCAIIKTNIEGLILMLSASIICALFSVCGDLIASLVKRHYGIKDYGFVFPGHGGVMDRFDSVLAVIPVLYIICYISLDFGIITAPIF